MRIILKKFPRRCPGDLRTLIDQPLGRLSISFLSDSQTQFDKVNCTILLTRDRSKYFQIKVVGNDGSYGVGREVILYQKS